MANLAALVALPALTELQLHHTGVATLHQLHPLLQLPQLKSLTLASSPINDLVLLRPFVLHTFPGLLRFNGLAVAAGERVAAGKMLGAMDAMLAAAMVGVARQGWRGAGEASTQSMLRIAQLVLCRMQVH